MHPELGGETTVLLLAIVRFHSACLILIQANEELRQKLSSPHPQTLKSPTNLVRDVPIHQRVEPSPDETHHQWAESSLEQDDHQWAESSQDEPPRQEVDSISRDQEPIETSQDQPTQQLACSGPSVGEGMESSPDQLVQEWVKSSENNQIKYYPPVKSPE